MAQLEKAEKDSLKKEFIEEVFRNSDAAIRKTGVSQCRITDHNWEKLNDTEIVCTKCPTVMIIDPANMGYYVK